MKPSPNAHDPPSPALGDELDAAERDLFAGCVAVLSAEAPQIQPSPLNLAVIRARLDAVAAPGPVQARPAATLRWTAWSGWAAAAAVTFLALGSSGIRLPHWARTLLHRGHADTALNSPGSPPAPGPMAGLPTGSEAGSPSANEKNHGDARNGPAGVPGRFWSGVDAPGNGPARQLVQDMAQLRRDFDRLQQAHAARFEPQPGLARMVVVEMGDPDQPAPTPGEKRLLTERAADALADGLKPASADRKESPDPKAPDGKTQTDPGTAPAASPPTPGPTALKLSGDGAQWSNDIVIDQGMVPLSRLTLDEGQQVRHLNFPTDTAENYGLERLDSGFFYDAHNHFVWRPTGEGNGYVGWKDESFDPEAYRSGSTAFPMPPSVLPTQPAAPPTPETPLAEPVAEPEPGSAGITPPARAFTLFDETSGSGSIILQDLPPAEQGTVYQLWLTDPASRQPISVGLLPDLPTGSDRVFFDFGRPGIAPTGYLITREPVGGAQTPGPTVILKGP